MIEQRKARFQLPAAEDDLWQQLVARLLEQRDVTEVHASDHLRLLEELGFHCRFCGQSLTTPFVEATCVWLAKERDFGDPWKKAQRWLSELEDWDFLVRKGKGPGATHEWSIPMLDEYFAGRHLAARWREKDRSYQAWLPSTRRWWWQRRKMRCPNPSCATILPPLCDLASQPESGDAILLMVGQLLDSDREEALLETMGLSPAWTWPGKISVPLAAQGPSLMRLPSQHRQHTRHLGFILRLLARCRFHHPVMLERVATSVLRLMQGPVEEVPLLHDEHLGIGDSRQAENRDSIVMHYISALSHADMGIREGAAFLLGVVGGPQVMRPLLECIKKGSVGAVFALVRIAGADAGPMLAEIVGELDEWTRSVVENAIAQSASRKIV
jgi:hypothetical protein